MNLNLNKQDYHCHHKCLKHFKDSFWSTQHLLEISPDYIIFINLYFYSPLYFHLHNMVCLSCAFKITGYMKDFIKNNKTFILLNKMKPYHKSLVLFLRHQKGRPHYGNGKTQVILWLSFPQSYLYCKWFSIRSKIIVK